MREGCDFSSVGYCLVLGQELGLELRLEMRYCGNRSRLVGTGKHASCLLSKAAVVDVAVASSLY